MSTSILFNIIQGVSVAQFSIVDLIVICCSRVDKAAKRVSGQKQAVEDMSYKIEPVAIICVKLSLHCCQASNMYKLVLACISHESCKTESN